MGDDGEHDTPTPVGQAEEETRQGEDGVLIVDSTLTAPRSRLAPSTVYPTVGSFFTYPAPCFDFLSSLAGTLSR